MVAAPNSIWSPTATSLRLPLESPLVSQTEANVGSYHRGSCGPIPQRVTNARSWVHPEAACKTKLLTDDMLECARAGRSSSSAPSVGIFVYIVLSLQLIVMKQRIRADRLTDCVLIRDELVLS